MSAAFDTILTSGHVDFVDVVYDVNDGWEASIHDEDSDIEYDPATTLLYVKPEAASTRPGGSQWDFLGVGAGQTVWVLPQIEDPNLLYGGIASEEMPGDFFDEYFNADPRVNASGRWLAFSVVDVRGPGSFSVWTTDQFGDPTVWIASADGLGATDVFFGLEGGHDHFNWGFTATGLYEVDFMVSAYLDGQRIESDPWTVNFGVEAVPEPTTLGALLVGVLAVARRRRR